MSPRKNKTWKCHHACGKQFTCKKEYRNHLIRQHGVFMCMECEVMCGSISQLNFHMHMHDAREMSVAKKPQEAVRNLDAIKKHLAGFIIPSAKPHRFLCLVCGRDTDDREVHFRTYHERPRKRNSGRRSLVHMAVEVDILAKLTSSLNISCIA